MRDLDAKLRNLGFWLAHPYWVRQAEEEGRGRWAPAPLNCLPQDLRQAVEAEIAAISAAYGADRAPCLFRERRI
ncbi:MAG: hypothetical protein N2Z67_10800 [Acetobacteraceae bacterium]|nr:hypothetical protein [Acetobacteraceae bacterium]